jgi:hypothetical protein
MADELAAFIESYGADLASGDGTRIAGNYDAHVLFVSGDSTYATPNDADFASWFSATSATYRERGFGDPHGEVTRTEELADRLCLAWVTWHYRDMSGSPMFDADYVYGLRRDEQADVLIGSVWSLNEAARAAEYLRLRS